MPFAVFDSYLYLLSFRQFYFVNGQCSLWSEKYMFNFCATLVLCSVEFLMCDVSLL